MSVSLLATKVHIPHARANGVSRLHLTEKLLAAVKRPGSFVLLSGPPGFGKTTLLSDFATTFQHPVTWISVDEGDNDPIRFWTYLITACQTIQRGIGESGLALLQSPQSGQTSSPSFRSKCRVSTKRVLSATFKTSTEAA